MARAIAAQSLAATGAGLARGDHAAFARCVWLPYSIGTEAGAVRIDTPEALRGIFDRAVENYTRLGISHLDRTVSGAFFFGRDKIVAGHLTLPYRKNSPWDVPYPNHVVLQMDGDAWKLTDGQHMVGHIDGHSRVLIGEPAPTAPEPMIETFRDVVHQFGNAQVRGDFDALIRVVTLPLCMHNRHTSTIIETVSQLREVFQQRMMLFKMRGVTDMVRNVRSVTMLRDDRMHGVVRTHVLNQTVLVVPAYTSAIILRRGVDGAWRIAAAGNPEPQHQLADRPNAPAATHRSPAALLSAAPDRKDQH